MPDDIFSILVTKELAGQRLDQILGTVISRRKAKKLLSYGAVFVNGKRMKVASRIMPEGVKIKAPYELPAAPPPIDWEKTLLFSNEHMAAVNKPYRWPSAPTPYGDKGTLSHALAAHLDKEVSVVQRLDVHTTGCLLYALSPHGARAITQAFMEKKVEKIYLAITPEQEVSPGLISLPLSPDPQNSARYVVDKNGKNAVTEILGVCPLKGGHQLLALKLHTGRTHQIRVHLAHLGMPVTGDLWYGGETYNRLFLHSYRLIVNTTSLGNHIFSSPLPEHWFEQFPLSADDVIKILD